MTQTLARRSVPAQWSAVGWTVVVLSLAICAAPKAPGYDDMRSMGMGNTTVAVTTDRTAIFHNPAGLGLIEDRLQLSLRPLTLAFDNKFFEYINFLSAHQSELSNIDKLDTNFVNSLDRFDGYWAMLQYMPEITVATKNIGFGIYSVFPFDTRVESGHFVPKLGFKGVRDLVFTWAVGIPLKSENNYFGISLQYLQRTPLNERITTFPETFQFTKDIGNKPLSTLGIVDQLAVVQHGATFSVGFMHNLKGGFRLAYDVRSIFGVIGGEMVIPQVDIGGAYFFPFLQQYKFIRNVIASVELSDLIGFEEQTGRYEQFPKKIHAGAEIDIRYFALRGGINQGYPTFGAGVMLGPASLDYVYFTEEAGLYSGQLPRTMHVISLALAINVAKKVDKNQPPAPGVREDTPSTPAGVPAAPSAPNEPAGK